MPKRSSMTPNHTLSIANALKHERPEDYYENTATIEWPLGPDGKAFPIIGSFFAAVVFKEGGNVATAKEFVRFLVGEGWLAHYLDFAGERCCRRCRSCSMRRSGSTRAIRTAWPRRCRSLRGPRNTTTAGSSGNWRYDQVWREIVWAKAVHRVAAEGVSPEQAVDEAIARIKQILSE